MSDVVPKRRRVSCRRVVEDLLGQGFTLDEIIHGSRGVRGKFFSAGLVKQAKEMRDERRARQANSELTGLPTSIPEEKA